MAVFSAQLDDTEPDPGSSKKRSQTLHLPAPHFRPLPLYAKLIIMMLVISCLFIGVLGLILPVIPGVLFLFLAALLFTRVSRRASAYAHKQPWFREQLLTWRASRNLSWGQRTRLSLLMAVKGLVSAVGAGVAFVNRRLRKR